MNIWRRKLMNKSKHGTSDHIQDSRELQPIQLTQRPRPACLSSFLTRFHILTQWFHILTARFHILTQRLLNNSDPATAIRIYNVWQDGGSFTSCNMQARGVNLSWEPPFPLRWHLCNPIVPEHFPTCNSQRWTFPPVNSLLIKDPFAGLYTSLARFEEMPR